MVVLVVYGRETKGSESASGSMWCSKIAMLKLYISYICPECVCVCVCVCV